MTFLPKDYKVPTESKYMKFKEGDNKFRVLSETPLIGWEYWTEEDGKRKPNRVEDWIDIPMEHRGEMKHFWAMVVWNYQESKMQILEITQKTILASLTVLANSKGWGDPVNYDVTVTATGAGMEREYPSVLPDPKSKFTEDADPSTVRLEALLEGEDPFALDVDDLMEEIEAS